MTKDEALRLLERGEGQAVEFKETTAQLPRAIKTLTAFTAQEGGGAVVFGIKDNGTPLKGFQVGANTIEKLAATVKENTLAMTMAEPLFPDVFTFTDPGLIVVVVSDDQVARGPFLAYGRRWERVGKSTHEVQIDYRKLASAYQQALYDHEYEGPLGYRFCPTCGRQELKRTEALDYAHDRLYYFIECSRCGWSDWTE